MLEKGLVRERHPARHHVDQRFGIDANLVLRVCIGTQAQEAHQIVQVGLPVPLRIGGKRQVDARELAGEAVAVGIDAGSALVLIQHPGVAVVAALAIGAQQVEHARRLVAGERVAAALPVRGRLRL